MYVNWNVYNPKNGGIGKYAKVNDGRGELFYYMHNQIIARYNAERICNGLGRVLPLSDLRKPIPEGYFSKMIQPTTNNAYPSRSKFTIPQSLNRDAAEINSIGNLELWRNRIIEAVDRGCIVEVGSIESRLDS